MPTVPETAVSTASSGMSFLDGIINGFLSNLGVNATLFLLGLSIVVLAWKSGWLLNLFSNFFYKINQWGWMGKLILYFIGFWFILASVNIDLIQLISSTVGKILGGS